MARVPALVIQTVNRLMFARRSLLANVGLFSKIVQVMPSDRFMQGFFYGYAVIS